MGGIYLAAELGVAGYKLRLHDIDDARLADIRAFGGIDVEGDRPGFAAVEHATSDLPSAVNGADVVIVVTGGNAQATAARSLAPLVRDGQMILLIQGNTGGSLIVRRTLDEARLPCQCRGRRDGQLSVLLPAAFAHSGTPDRHQTLAADCSLPRQSYRVGTPAPRATISASCSSSERSLHWAHQCQCHAACRELCCQRRTDREWRQL